MSTPEQPGTPPLTRRQLRELRNTASTPIITPEDAYEAAAAAAAERAASDSAGGDDAREPAAADSPPAGAKDDAAEEADAAPEATLEGADESDGEPEPDGSAEDAPQDVEPTPQPQIPAAVDLDAAPVSRRQARQQAKLRTAAIEVIPSADQAAADAGDPGLAASDAGEPHDDVADVHVDDADVHVDDADVHVDDADVHVDGAEVHEGDPDVHVDDADAHVDDADVDEDDHPVHEDAPAPGEVDGDVAGETDAEMAEDADVVSEDATPSPSPGADDDLPLVHVVSPGLGAQLLAGEPGEIELPPSFDHLLSRGGAGSSSAPNALILSQTPDTGSLSVPILGTGELLITGSYALPETYGSTGTLPGAQDGKDVDAALIDGELPPASSPTPISASAAISTIKSADEIIRPPAPEKGSRLMMTLAITAGALALALATVLILAVVNGVF
ncbi:hypothetical protein AB3M83_09580 [Microbacterium sp. 179-B 1A2 NHS]|uniref:hypothetical protein n=1 Tax=Microbacterium sp. 179-B 1A2 NHS TaxID=3142383 RepID=UPI0039A2E760